MGNQIKHAWMRKDFILKIIFRQIQINLIIEKSTKKIK